ncbi:MAG: hypothetical protein H6Q33_954 [Deltaproteobacteria bacterium]|nr:hypothetical protein [Deltaproteobacteria bacterium]
MLEPQRLTDSKHIRGIWLSARGGWSPTRFHRPYASGRSLLVDLLRKVILLTDLFDQIELRFEPVDVLLF